MSSLSLSLSSESLSIIYLEKSRVVQHGPGERTFHFFLLSIRWSWRENRWIISILTIRRTYRYWEIVFFLLRCKSLRMIIRSEFSKIHVEEKSFPVDRIWNMCRQMFNTQKAIMRTSGIYKRGKDSSMNSFFLDQRNWSIWCRIWIWSSPFSAAILHLTNIRFSTGWWNWWCLHRKWISIRSW